MARACMRSSGLSLVNLPPAKPLGYPMSWTIQMRMSRFFASATNRLKKAKYSGERYACFIPPPAWAVTAWKPRLFMVSRSFDRLSMDTGPFIPKYGSGPYSEGGFVKAFATSAAVGICIFCQGYCGDVDCAKHGWTGKASINATVTVTHRTIRRELRSSLVTNLVFRSEERRV